MTNDVVFTVATLHVANGITGCLVRVNMFQLECRNTNQECTNIICDNDGGD